MKLVFPVPSSPITRILKRYSRTSGIILVDCFDIVCEGVPLINEFVLVGTVVVFANVVIVDFEDDADGSGVGVDVSMKFEPDNCDF